MHPRAANLNEETRDFENFSGLTNQGSIEAFNEPLGVTVDGRNPANQLIGSVSHYSQVFLTSQVVQDFSHSQYVWWLLQFHRDKRSEEVEMMGK